MIFSAVVVEFSFEPLVALLRKADQLFSVRRAMLTRFAGKNNRSYNHCTVGTRSTFFSNSPPVAG